VQSKAQVCNCYIAGIAGSNPDEGKCSSLLLVVWCVGSGLCDELITRPEGSYGVCVCACVRARMYAMWKPQQRDCLGPFWTAAPYIRNKEHRTHFHGENSFRRNALSPF
jgi:hypothetical protein